MMRNKREIMNTDKIIKLMEEKNITLYRLGKMTNLNESNLGQLHSLLYHSVPTDQQP